MSAKELGCARCGQMHDQLVEAMEDRNALTATVARESKRANALGAQLAAQHKADPRNAIVREILEHWQKATGHDKTKLPMDGKRAQLVRARLKDFTPEELKLSAEGYGHFPNVKDKQRVPADAGGKCYDDIPTIFLDETRVENGLKLLKRWQASSERGTSDGAGTTPPVIPQPRSPGAWHPTGPVYTASPLDRAVAALRREFGFDRTFGADWDEKAMRYLDYWAPCPIRPAMASPMRIREQGDGWSPRGGSLFLACVHGCTHDELFEALRVVEQKQERLKAEAVSRAVAA